MTRNKPDLKCKNAKQRDERGPHVSEAEILIMKFTSEKKNALFLGIKKKKLNLCSKMLPARCLNVRFRASE